jgi:hypothetical protein
MASRSRAIECAAEPVRFASSRSERNSASGSRAQAREVPERVQQHARGVGDDPRRVGAGLIEFLLRREEEPQQVLRALGVPPDPEHVGMRAGCERRDRARRRPAWGGRDLAEVLVGVGLGALQYPDILRARRGIRVLAHGREAADERAVCGAVAEGERPEGQRLRCGMADPAARHAVHAPHGRL